MRKENKRNCRQTNIHAYAKKNGLRRKKAKRKKEKLINLGRRCRVLEEEEEVCYVSSVITFDSKYIININ